MNNKVSFTNRRTTRILFRKIALLLTSSFLLFFISSGLTISQNLSISMHADPAICWFSTDTKLVRNEGSRAGFDFGINIRKFFSPNYAFSTGISLENAGGRLISSETFEMKFPNFTSTVLPGKPVVYKLQYLAVPVGLKLQTNQIGYFTLFSDIGFDPKVLVGGKADIPSLDISGENASEELRTFNLSYHIMAGIEYSLGGTTAVVIGLGFNNNFLDVTKDRGDQLKDKVSHKILKFRFGINF